MMSEEIKAMSTKQLTSFLRRRDVDTRQYCDKQNLVEKALECIKSPAPPESCMHRRQQHFFDYVVDERFFLPLLAHWCLNRQELVTTGDFLLSCSCLALENVKMRGGKVVTTKKLLQIMPIKYVIKQGERIPSSWSILAQRVLERPAKLIGVVSQTCGHVLLIDTCHFDSVDAFRRFFAKPDLLQADRAEAIAKAVVGTNAIIKPEAPTPLLPVQVVRCEDSEAGNTYVNASQQLAKEEEFCVQDIGTHVQPFFKHQSSKQVKRRSLNTPNLSSHLFCLEVNKACVAFIFCNIAGKMPRQTFNQYNYDERMLPKGMAKAQCPFVYIAFALVSQKVRRRGYGEALLKQVESTVFDEHSNAKEVVFQLHSKKTAESFWESKGFEFYGLSSPRVMLRRSQNPNVRTHLQQVISQALVIPTQFMENNPVLLALPLSSPTVASPNNVDAVAPPNATWDADGDQDDEAPAASSSS